jgi:hypothetical protein
MEVRAPVEKEKKTTPRIIKKILTSLSVVLVPLISPYPTVVIVVTVKYRAVM